MKKITLLIAFVLTILQGNAQVSSYGFAQSNDVFTEITGGAVIATPTANTVAGSLDSFVSPALTLPFSFNYNGINVSSVYMSSNGFISLGGNAPSTTAYTPISTSSTADGIVSAWAGDINTFFNLGSRTGDMRWETIGVSPNREIVFQWKDFRPAYSTSTTNAYGFNFQIRLIENGNNIKIVYGPGSFAVGSTAVTTGTRQIGLRGTTTADFNNRVFTSFASASAAGTLNSSSNSYSTATNFPGNGLTLTWSPPPACSGTPVAGSVTPATQNICTGSTPANLVATGYTTGATGITFQWEESDDNGVGDAWAPVVGGTGATTATYTPPAFAGSTIYYRLNVTCTASAQSAQTASVSINQPSAPVTQASAIITSNVLYTSATASWTNGSGNRRIVIVSDNSVITDPVNSNGQPALTANSMYSGSGQQIVYDGTGTTVNVYGLGCNATYYFKVFDYTRCGSGPYDYYYNVTTGTNTTSVLTGTPSSATLPVVNNFTGFTGANLSTVFPGWYESAIPTPATSTPLSASPGTSASNWVSSTALTVTTAKINLYTNTRNEWIISPKITLTGASRVLFKAAITDFASGGVDPVKMAGTDDKVDVMISVDGCGSSWTPIYTFDASNTTTLTNVLTDYVLDISAYTGQTIQIAFRGTDGPLDDTPDYDFHITNINVELIPSCAYPAGLAVNNLNSTSADITWSATTGNYEYVLDNVATDPAGSGTPLSGEIYNATLSPSTTYYFHVRTVCAGPSYSAWSTISFTTPATPPVNDNCGNAIALTVGGTFGDNDIPGTILAASTTAGVTPTCQASFSADVWYSVTVPASGSVTIETQVASSNSMTDSVVAAFSGTCGSLTQIGCDDDGGPSGVNNLMSILSLTGRTPGEVIYVGVWKYNTTAPTSTNSEFIVSAYDSSLSTNSFDRTSLKVYPNPVNDVLNLSYSSEISSVEVFNMLGQKVLAKDLNASQGQINISSLNSGNYFVKVTSEGQSKTIKIVKN